MSNLHDAMADLLALLGRTLVDEAEKLDIAEKLHSNRVSVPTLLLLTESELDDLIHDLFPAAPLGAKLGFKTAIRSQKESVAPPAGQATSEEDDRLQKLLEGVQMMIERSELEARKKSHRISEANSTVFQEILSSGCVEGIENVPVLFDAKKHKTRNVPEFEWNDAVESGQAARYVKYVEEYLVQSEKEKEWSVINGNKHPKLLNGILKGNREGTEFRGTTDVVVVQRGAEGLPQTGLKILFELKKVGTISGHAEYQTIFSLLLANTICRHLRPIAVLTDLVDKWVLYYCDLSIVYRHTFSSRSEAVGYLDAILEDDTDPEAVSHDTRHGTPALRSPGESSSRGVKRSFSGRRIFSIPALEQLEELAGFLPEDELRQGRAAIALQCALNIPAFYSVVSDLREAPEGIYS